MRKSAKASMNKSTAPKRYNIALTGLMGCGKSSVGKTLARFLNKEFVDTDELIERKESKTINQIFEESGEEYFRKLESEVIKEVFQEKGQVISLGGGATVNKLNRKIIRENSKLITLVANPKTLYERVKRRKHRPLLNTKENTLGTLERLWIEREKAYMDSDLQINIDDLSLNEIANIIIHKLKLHKRESFDLKVEIPKQSSRYFIKFQPLSRIDLSKLRLGKNILVLSQDPISRHYLAPLIKVLQVNFKVHTLIIENGENAKNFFTYQLITQKLLSLNFERNDTLLALGGGVVGDIGGFSASTYFRGINYIQVPTTLLAMIDSSVGGKTGINVPEGKNLVGSFYQPRLVYIDVQNLKTLDPREFRSGLGELVKYTLLGSRWDNLLYTEGGFFNYVFNNADLILNQDPDVLKTVVEHSLVIKTQIVIEDELERGLRAHLNLGHTFGHALEELTKFKKYSHGEAVAVGIACASYLSEELGLWKEEQTNLVIKLMDKLGLEYRLPKEIDLKDMLNAFKHDKKVEEGQFRFVLPKNKIGKVEIIKSPDINSIKKAMKRNQA